MKSAVHTHGPQKGANRGVLKVAPKQWPVLMHRELKNSSCTFCMIRIAILLIHNSTYYYNSTTVYSCIIPGWYTGDGTWVVITKYQ